MNIPAHLAAQLLETDFENLCSKLKAGATLTSAERSFLQKCAAQAAGSAPPPLVTAAEAAPASESSPTRDDAFHLEPTTTKFRVVDLERFSEWYGKKPRQIRRWIEEGKLHDDPCPLEAPALMPLWWARRMKHRCPQLILDRAAAVKSEAVVSQAVPATPHESAPPPPANGTAFKIDLAALDPEEGDRLRELKQVQAAKFAELSSAFATGNETAHLESRYIKLCEALDKMESRVIERLKKQGRYILRDTIEAALAANAELLVQAHESMERRILERCPSLTAAQREEVRAAVRIARASEIKTLSRIPEMNDDEIELELAS